MTSRTNVSPKNNVLNYKCVVCGAKLDFSAKREGNTACPQCKFNYTYGPNFFGYDFDTLLYRKFRSTYLLNKVLNNNAYLSYIFLKEASVSLPGRPDVARFKEFIQKHVPQGTLLDIGCGTLDLPGYLNFEEIDNYKIYGLDPLECKTFKGTRIRGCSEFLPFFDGVFDAAIFATSLDHVCSLDRTVEEAYRVIAEQGRAVIWTGDNTETFWFKIWKTLTLPWRNFRKGYDTRKYRVYDNHTVLAVPKGAVDPFHSFGETPVQIMRLFARKGFEKIDFIKNNSNEVFLSFKKSPKSTP